MRTMPGALFPDKGLDETSVDDIAEAVGASSRSFLRCQRIDPAPAALRVMAQTLGLPTTLGFTYRARPDWIVPNEDYRANTTWVAKTVSLPEE